MKRWQKITLAVVLIIKLIIVTATMGFAGDEYVLTFTNITASAANQGATSCTLNGAAISADCPILVKDADTIQVQWDTLTITNVSTDIDINIITSNNCIKYQNGTTATTGIFYQTETIGDEVIGAIPGGLTPAGKCIKVRIDNDDGVNAAGIEISVYVTR